MSGDMRQSPIVSQALADCRPAFLVVAVFSGIVNVLALSGSLYMLQVYDRVLSSRSLATLIGLSALLALAYGLQGVIEIVRSRMLARIGLLFSARVAPAAFAATQKLPLAGVHSEHAVRPLRDLDQIKSFLSSLGPTALFDLPWLPLFVIVCGLIHWQLAALVIAGAVVTLMLAALTEMRGRKHVAAQIEHGASRWSMAEAGRRNAEAIKAMGMAKAFRERWSALDADYNRSWLAGADTVNTIGNAAKIFRMLLQSAVLGFGAYLVIAEQITGGGMIAASIMSSRALAPVEIAVAHWKGFVASRQALQRLGKVLDDPLVRDSPKTALPAPSKTLDVADIYAAAPGQTLPIVTGVTIRLKAGDGLAIIGPSASGKSTLARVLVGVWRASRGEVRIDGAALSQWEDEALGRHIGYLPQDIELFEGTVAENISRFDPDDSGAAVMAAMAANAHQLIVSLPDGYDTRIGEGGAALSAGQRQRIALARAMYRDPFLVVLDEPNSNLDQEGDQALTGAIRSIRDRGGIVVVVTHRPAAIAAVDQVAVMAKGRIQAIGPKEEILKKIMKQGADPGFYRKSDAS